MRRNAPSAACEKESSFFSGNPGPRAEGKDRWNCFMRRLLFAACLLIAGFGGIGLGSSGHALAAPAPCGKGSALCFVAGAAGSDWNLTLYGSKLQPGTFVNYSYSTLEGGGFGS